MKIKVYNANDVNKPFKLIPSQISQNLEILLASMSNKKSVIKNISHSITLDNTIAWAIKCGAIIKEANNKLIIKGIGNIPNFSNALFECTSLNTAKLFIPLFATLDFPVGIRINKNDIFKLRIFKEILEPLNIKYIEDNDIIRIEGMLQPFNVNLDGNLDYHIICGFMLAASLLKGESSISLKSPVNNRMFVVMATKILRKFEVPVELKGSNIKILGGKIGSVKVQTRYSFSYIGFIGSLTNAFKTNIRLESSLNRKNIVLFPVLNHYFRKFFTIRNKKIIKNDSYNKVYVVNNYETLYPLVFASLTSSTGGCIKIVDLNIKELLEALDKIELSYTYEKDVLVIEPYKFNKKVQVDCKSLIPLAYLLTFIAIQGKNPIIIKNADCIFYDNLDFFDLLKENNIKVEYIHD